jgi:hypothetical protein
MSDEMPIPCEVYHLPTHSWIPATMTIKRTDDYMSITVQFKASHQKLFATQILQRGLRLRKPEDHTP